MIKNNYIKHIAKKAIAILILLIVFFSILAPTVQAETAIEKKKRLEKEIEAAKGDQQYIKSEMTKGVEAINELQRNIEEKDIEIEKLEKEIEGTQEEVERIAKELKEQEEECSKQEVLVKKRLTFMYESGQYNSWEILLKSNGLMDFLSNYYMLQELSKIDNEILSESSRNKRKIEILKKELDSKEKVLTEAQTNIKKSKIAQQNIMVAKEAEVAKLSKKEKDLLSKIDNLQAKRREAEREIERAAAHYIGNTLYVGGEFGWPAPNASAITTYFGEYYEYSTDYHKGIDISGPGNQPIVAANGGTVVETKNNVDGFSYTAQYGNYVIIDHGGGFFTMYAHGRYGSVIVSPGQEVERGEKLMTMGDTGYSFGQHLHFELVKDPYQPYQYSGAYRIDPLPYLKRKLR